MSTMDASTVGPMPPHDGNTPNEAKFQKKTSNATRHPQKNNADTVSNKRQRDDSVSKYYKRPRHQCPETFNQRTTDAVIEVGTRSSPSDGGRYPAAISNGVRDGPMTEDAHNFPIHRRTSRRMTPPDRRPRPRPDQGSSGAYNKASNINQPGDQERCGILFSFNSIK